LPWICNDLNATHIAVLRKNAKVDSNRFAAGPLDTVSFHVRDIVIHRRDPPLRDIAQ